MRGLVVFSPSGLVFGEPIIAVIIAPLFGGDPDGLFVLNNAEVMLVLAILLCFYTGYLLEKWEGSESVQTSRVLVNGFLILIGNAVLVLVGGIVIFVAALLLSKPT